MPQTTLEQLVQHLDEAGSFFGVDFDKVRQGLKDAARRIQKLEDAAKVAAKSAPKPIN